MKCLCLYVDGGKGHYVPAKAVHDALEQLNVDSEIDEFFDYLDIRWLGRINKFFWRTMLRFPKNRNFFMFLLVKLSLMSFDKFSLLYSFLKTYLKCDVFSAPVASICNKLKGFLIATEEGLNICREMGQKEDTLMLSPFPLQQSIAESPVLTKQEARSKLGLDIDRFTLQLNLGGEGIGSLALLRDIIHNDLDMQVVILGGISNKEKNKIQKIVRSGSRTSVYIPGFVKNVNEYLAASDIIAGRAGINTIVEAIYAHRPFLITELVYTVIPSADYIEKYNVGWNCTDNRKKALDIVSYYVQNQDKISDLDQAFDKVPIKYSAKELAAMLIKDVESVC